MSNTQTTSNRVLIATAAVLTSLAVASVSSAVGDEPCDPLEVFNPIVFPPTGADPLLSNWVHQDNASTFLLGSDGAPIGAPAAENTEQPNLVWQKLVSFPESTPLHIQIKDPDTHEIVPYTIDNPVLVISLNVNKPSIFSGSGFQSVRDDYLPILDLNSNGEVVFRPYKVNTDDKTYNNWMTAHIAEQEGDEVGHLPSAHHPVVDLWHHRGVDSLALGNVLHWHSGYTAVGADKVHRHTALLANEAEVAAA